MSATIAADDQSSESAPVDDVLRVTITARSSSADLTLPSRIPLGEILPEVIRALGVMDPDDVHAGYRVCTAAGKSLRLESGLAAQGVVDGGVLTIQPGVDDEPARAYDDIVEAVADVVEEQAGGWSPQASRLTLVAIAGLLGLLAAWTLRIAGLEPGATAMIAACLALVLTLGAAVLAIVRRDSPGSFLSYGLALAFALLAAEAWASTGATTAILGGLSGAAIAAAMLATRRQIAWPAVAILAVGLIIAMTGWAVASTDAAAGQILTGTVVILTLGASLAPRYALQLARAEPPMIDSEAAILRDPEAIDPRTVERKVALASQVSSGLTLTLALLLVVAGPIIVGLGPAAFLVAWTVAGLLVLGARREARPAPLIIAVTGGSLAAVTSVIGAALAHPEWIPALAVVSALAALPLLLVIAFPPRSALLPPRALDVGESVLLVALVPLTVLALDVLPL